VADSIDNIDLTVYGGPTAIDLSVDFGTQGNRGSRSWIGSGDPSITLAGQDIALYDWYINTNTSQTYYSWLYQYVTEAGNPVWTPVLKLNPAQYSTIATTTFTTGSTTITVPVKNLTAINGVILSNFVIRYKILNANPIADAFTVTLTGTYPNQNLSIVLNGISYNGSTWSQLTGSQDVHLFISYLG
jgi:hypothetical protein